MNKLTIMKTQKWFTDRIGKRIHCSSANNYNGPIHIADAGHAKHLYEVEQIKNGFCFSEKKETIAA